MKEDNTPTLYTYRIPYDTGAAPNPFWGICTLTICKPVIRRVAQKGDWVVGTGSKSLPLGDISKHVVYAMKVTGKLTLEEYDRFCKEEYPNKIPDWNNEDYRRRMGDCIYNFSDGALTEIRPGVHNEENVERDLGGKYALISDYFSYFGDHPIKLPKKLQKIIPKGRGHQSKSNAPYVGKFISWIESLEMKPNKLKLYGDPQIKVCPKQKCQSYH